MSTLNIARLVGVLSGFAVGIVLVIIIAKICNRNRSMKTEYDERQNIIRGNGYKYGFYAMMIYAALLVVLGVAEIDLPAEPCVTAFSIIFVGGLVDCVYCIWNDAYWGLNNNKVRYAVFFVIAAVVNAAAVIMAWIDHELIVDGRLGLMGLNMMVTVMLMIIAVVLGIQAIREKREV